MLFGPVAMFLSFRFEDCSCYAGAAVKAKKASVAMTGLAAFCIAAVAVEELAISELKRNCTF